MRQAIFVVVMVGAAFLGGAVVNGPGLRWVQARLLDYMGLQDGGEIASIDLPQPNSDPANPHHPGTTPAASQPNTQTRASSAESHVIRQSPPSSPVTGSSRLRSSPTPASTVPPPLPIPMAIPEPAVSKPANLPTVGSSANSASVPSPAPLDPSVGTALLTSRSPSLTEPTAGEQTAPAAITLETAPSTSTTSMAGSPVPKPTGNGARTTERPSDWATLRRKMQSLGVTRYTIEGEPSGRVVFCCLIPLAGRQAVSQRFEGEGDDEFHAAHAAIRRIALWRATRPTSAP